MRQIAEDFLILQHAVAEAATLVMGYFGQSPETWDKPGEGPVTEADLAADRLLHARLMGARPGYGWLSEETADTSDRLSRSHVWIIDPIDGTRAFIEGKPEFTICAGLAVEGKVVAGVVLNPAKAETFIAMRGAGATRNGVPLAIDIAPTLGDASILSRRGILKDDVWIDPAIKPRGRHGYVNSIAYRVVKIATGRWDTAIALNRLSEWDVAAAQIILEEAGGCLTQRDGSEIAYNKKAPKVQGLVAARSELNTEIVASLAPPKPAQ